MEKKMMNEKELNKVNGGEDYGELEIVIAPKDIQVFEHNEVAGQTHKLSNDVKCELKSRFEGGIVNLLVIDGWAEIDVYDKYGKIYRHYSTNRFNVKESDCRKFFK